MMLESKEVTLTLVRRRGLFSYSIGRFKKNIISKFVGQLSLALIIALSLGLSDVQAKEVNSVKGKGKGKGKKEGVVYEIDPITGEIIEKKIDGDWSYQGRLSTTVSSEINKPLETDLYDQELGISVSGTATHAQSKTTLSLRTSLAQELTYEPTNGRSTRLGNLSGSVSRQIKLPFFSYSSVGFDGVLGTSKESAQASFRGAMGPSIYVSKSIGKWNLSQSFFYTYRFYEYDMTIAGSVNSPHVYGMSTGARYSVLKSLSVGGTMSFQNTVSFQDVTRTVASLNLSTTYSFLKRFSASLGFSSSTLTLDPSGQRTEVDLLDPRKAVVYVNLSASI